MNQQILKPHIGTLNHCNDNKIWKCQHRTTHNVGLTCWCLPPFL